MILGLSGEGLREALAKALALLSSGVTDEMAAEQMGLSLAEFAKVKEELLAKEAERLRGQTTEEVYAGYVINQLACINDLLAVQKDFSGSKQASAVVGAIRARSEILDKIVTRGQEFGFVEKEPSRTHITGGLLVAEMSNTDLKQAIMKQAGQLDQLMEVAGKDCDLMELEPGPLHRKALPEGSKHLKANTVRRHGGRAVFRRKA